MSVVDATEIATSTEIEKFGRFALQACMLAGIYLWTLILAAKRSAQAPTTTTTMTSCSGNQQPNLLECEAAELALYLLEHRFSVNFICFDLQCSLHSIGLMVLSKVAE